MEGSIIGLDFETYALTDLITNGLDNYVACENFTPLIACITGPEPEQRTLLDFVANFDQATRELVELISGHYIAAHNAGFEQAVLSRLGIFVPSDRFIDTAVLARASGAAGKLEAAAPQLLGTDKLETGFALIKLFSIPGEYQARKMQGAFDPQVIADHPDEWEEFAHYCQVDADLSYELAKHLMHSVGQRELMFEAVTMDMNNVGWYVDVPLVKEMQQRYLANVEEAVTAFRTVCGAPTLNLSSYPQLKAWCEERGVKAKSFDENAVVKLKESLTRRLERGGLTPKQALGYTEVLELLNTKQVMGGSSLKKLQTILDRVGEGDRLRDQYLHCGAGATFRTSGRGVQMQNLKRLNGQGDDVELLYDPSVNWDNDQLASNLRQVFRATDKDGKLIVGDFSSVESRGLAWQAGEQWKLDAYAAGRDLYKAQAGVIFGKSYDQVTKQERQVGKVGELSCGYGAGPEAVQQFAAKMGVEMSLPEAGRLVKDWRNANAGIVTYWHDLDEALKLALEGDVTLVSLPMATVYIVPTMAPKSLRDQTDDQSLLSFDIWMEVEGAKPLFKRMIHGVHAHGRNIQYWKPSERKTGDLWVSTFTDPKTKLTRPYTLYGGKLAGILTQSLCREVFFNSLTMVSDWVDKNENIKLVGQFHDEIVLDWQFEPGKPDEGQTMKQLHTFMTSTVLPNFPLEAVVKSDFRYTK
jgi:DNA polymerase